MTTVSLRYKEATKFIGLGLALAMRLGLLFFVNNILNMDQSFFYIGKLEMTYKECLFIVGGFFLIYKAGGEMRKIVMNEKEAPNAPKKILRPGGSAFKQFIITVIQIIFIDFIFSIDSVIVAIALVSDMKIIIIATLVSMATLLVSTNYLAKILIKYPSIKLLAMAFIVAIGIVFVLDGFEVHFDRSYIHVALFFALIFEIFDIMRIKNLNENNENK
jgi:predicted tellurium resistance membrane protein TerC